MTQFICLANSKKHHGRCIAGICPNTGKWIRPIVRGKTAIYEERFIDGLNANEPRLLDLLDISFSEKAPEEGCQPENIFIANQKWKRLKQLTVNEIEKYIEETKLLLHSHDNKVDPTIFSTLPHSSWKSLQLIKVNDAEFFSRQYENIECFCSFTYSGTHYRLKLTVIIAIDKIKIGAHLNSRCLLTVSMTTPFKTPAYEIPYCWKMVAGVIELS
jgi:hypothetical protein